MNDLKNHKSIITNQCATMNLLEPYTIIDFTRLLPGPLATNLLAQMGARVIKVEHPGRKDYARRQPPFAGNTSTLYAALNFAKEERCINFEEKAGRRELMDLIREADVVIEQFRPGVMSAWQLGYEDLRKVNEQIIYISLSGYGQDGPYRNRAGHDLNYLAYSGILSLTRDRRQHPVIPGVQVADIGGGSYMVLSACLAALLQRERTGQGAYVDVSMLDGLLPMLSVPASQHWGGFDPYQVDFLSGALVNYNVYECNDGKWIALGALEMKFWNNFCDWAGRPDWKRANQLELSVMAFPKKEIEDFFKIKTQAEWIEAAAEADICLTPVRRVEELEADPHIQARGGIVEFENEQGHRLKGFAPPFRIRTSDPET